MGLFSSLGGIAGATIGNMIAPGIGGTIGGGIGSSLGGSFGGSGGVPGAPGNSLMGGPQYQYQQYNREKVLPDYLQQPYEDTVSAVMDAGTRPFNPYEFQDRPELFSPDERRAQELYRGIPDKYSPYIQGGLDVVGEAQRMALQGPSSELIQGYMNPFIEQTLDVQKRRSLQDYQMMQSDLQRRAGQVDSFGGDRFGLQSAQLADDFALRQDQLESQMLMGGYDRAQAAMERGLERGMDPRYLGGLQSIDLQGIKALDVSGEKQYLRDFSEFMREESDPMLKAGFLAQNIQPLASTVIGERGTNLTYTDPNVGSLGQGLAFGSALGGLFGSEEMGGIGDFLQDNLGTRFGIAENFGQSEGGGVPIPARRPAIFSNQGGLLALNEGGAVDPYDMYINAASAGGFITPTPFGSWPDGLGAFSGTLGGGEDTTPSGGLLGVLEGLQKDSDESTGKDESKTTDEKGSAESEGKEVPGPEAESLADQFLKAVAILRGQYNEGGNTTPRLSKTDAIEIEDMLSSGDFQGLVDRLNLDKSEYPLNAEILERALRGTFGNSVAPSGVPPIPARRPEGLQAFAEGGQVPIPGVKPEEEEERRGIAARVGNWVKENPEEAIGLGLTFIPQLGLAGKAGKGALGVGKKGLAALTKKKGLKKGKDSASLARKIGDKAWKQKANITSGIGAGLYLKGALGGAEELLKETENQEKALESLKEEAAKTTRKGTLSLPASSGIPTRSDIRKDLRASLSSAKKEEGVNRAALLAFGAKISEGGGFMNSFPKAALAYSDAVASQSASKFKKQKELLELEQDMYQKEINRATAEAALEIAEQKRKLLPIKAQTELAKANAAYIEARRSGQPDAGDYLDLAQASMLKGAINDPSFPSWVEFTGGTSSDPALDIIMSITKD